MTSKLLFKIADNFTWGVNRVTSTLASCVYLLQFTVGGKPTLGKIYRQESIIWMNKNYILILKRGVVR